FDAFRWVLFESKFFIWLKNSLFVYLITLSTSLIVIIPAAYSFSRFKFRGKKSLLSGYFILSQIMTGMGVIGLIALYSLLLKLGMINSLLILGLVYTASLVPYISWYLKSYLDTIPTDFDEAALMDGASFFQNLRHVIFPIAKPGIAVAIIFITIITWSEWVLASILLGSENFTLALGLVSLQVRWETPWNYFAATSILYAIPIMVIFTLAQRYLKAGLTLGGIKQ
ncbi:MAG: ABC transporter permease subunit, partial [Candidatus Hadarchaeum sp.]|uniref:ABC transporter permease subunit n=1 Tax=Candidatus Hadarchaeum sp. TaxID=2883567 RepID=UPI003D097A95